jgi:hypothetical protein
MEGTAKTDPRSELRFLRETAESMRRIAASLPVELGHEVLRVARRIEYDADELEEKLNQP